MLHSEGNFVRLDFSGATFEAVRKAKAQQRGSAVEPLKLFLA